MAYKEIRNLLKGTKCKIEAGITGTRVEPNNFLEKREIIKRLVEAGANFQERPISLFILR